MISDYVEERNNLDDLELVNLDNDNPTLFEYKSLASSQKESIDYCKNMKNRPQKRNINLHGFNQTGALQVTLRMLCDLNQDVNYELIMNTGKGLHSNKSDNVSPKSVLYTRLDSSIRQLINVNPQTGENAGTLEVQITNLSHNNDTTFES